MPAGALTTSNATNVMKPTPRTASRQRLRIKLLRTLGLVLGGAAVALGGVAFYLLHTSPPEAPGSGAPIRSGTIRVGGLERTYQVYVPAALADRPAILLAFHGSRGDGQTMRAFTGYAFERLADRHGFIVAYPDGYERHWNDCRANAPYAANVLDVDDLGFVRALVRRLAAAYGADTGRVFATGFSNGGHLAYRLALETPQMVRGVAAIGANLPTPDNLDCTPAGAPVAVLIMNGTADPLNPFEGGEVGLHGFLKRGTVRSAHASAEYFARLAGEAPVVPARTQVYGDAAGDVIDRTTWDAPGRPPVSLLAVRGGGHTIPQPAYRFPRLLGRTPATLNGPAEIWTFFEQQMQADRDGTPKS